MTFTWNGKPATKRLDQLGAVQTRFLLQPGMGSLPLVSVDMNL